jgi:hypothetical protein
VPKLNALSRISAVQGRLVQLKLDGSDRIDSVALNDPGDLWVDCLKSPYAHDRGCQIAGEPEVLSFMTEAVVPSNEAGTDAGQDGFA